MNDNDREAIEFAGMLRNSYGCAGAFLLFFITVYGVLRLFGVDDEVIAWLVKNGVLVPK